MNDIDISILNNLTSSLAMAPKYYKTFIGSIKTGSPKLADAIIAIEEAFNKSQPATIQELKVVAVALSTNTDNSIKQAGRILQGSVIRFEKDKQRLENYNKRRNIV